MNGYRQRRWSDVRALRVGKSVTFDHHNMATVRVYACRLGQQHQRKFSVTVRENGTSCTIKRTA